LVHKHLCCKGKIAEKRCFCLTVAGSGTYSVA
jgi:hypothetical protein